MSGQQKPPDQYLGFVQWDEKGRRQEIRCPDSHVHTTHGAAQNCVRQAFFDTGRTVARTIGSEKK